jgi:C4-dicarboxylate-specific signal transduction histidine kinase
MATNRFSSSEIARSVVALLLAGFAIAVTTLICYRYSVNSTTVGLLFLIVIVVLSLRASLLPAAAISIIAYLCLDYFFTAPLFTLGMNQTLDFVAPVAYLATAFVITRLISNVRKAEEDRKRAEESLRASQAELAHISRVLTMGELAASIAHEINQPLTAIVTNGSACVRWLSGDDPNLDEAREAAQRIVRDGHAASDIMKRIRAFLKKTETQKGPVDINQTIQEVVELTRDQARSNGVKLHMELHDVPSVKGDRIQLQQVIVNLVLNGIEAAATVNGQPRQVVVSTHATGNDEVLVSVQDSGPGIDAADSAKIFDAFYSTKAEGLGLGLAISQSIVEDHGGRISGTSHDGSGAIFEFTLPILR